MIAGTYLHGNAECAEVPEAVHCRCRHLLSGLNWRRSPPRDLPGGGLRPDWLVPLLSLLLGLSRLDLSCNPSDSACPNESPLELPCFSPGLCFLYLGGAILFPRIQLAVPYGSSPVQLPANFRPRVGLVRTAAN